jgi:carboxyl-terminal processing protease
VRYGNFTPMLAKLDALHDARVAKNKEFQWWSEDVARFRDQREKGYVSLNEADRRAERDADQARRNERQAQRKELGLKLDPLAADSDDDGLQANERNVVADAAREKAAEDRPDPLLREAATILADATAMLSGDKQLAATVLPETGRATHWAE